jgi:hypothetical protein
VNFKVREAPSQSMGIQLINGKHTNAALRATGAADQPVAAPPLRVDQGSVHDLYQRAIFDSRKSRRHTDASYHITLII